MSDIQVFCNSLFRNSRFMNCPRLQLQWQCWLQCTLSAFRWYCWWTRSFLQLLICSLSVYPIIYEVLYIPGGCLGFLPSTVLGGWAPSGCKQLGSPPSASHEWPFGRGPTTPGLGDFLTRLVNHILSEMILQVFGSSMVMGVPLLGVPRISIDLSRRKLLFSSKSIFFVTIGSNPPPARNGNRVGFLYTIYGDSRAK